MKPTLFLLIAMTAVAQLRGETVTAKKTKDFMGSIGVNIKMRSAGHQDIGAYNDINQVKNRLQELKIKQVRTGAHGLMNGGTYEADFKNRANTLNNAGIKLVGWWGGDYGLSGWSAWDWKNRCKQISSCFLAFEGPNEPDLEPFEYEGQGFPSGVRNFMSDMFSAVNGDSTLRNKPVLGPSIGHADKLYYGTLLGDLSGDCDKGNMRYYKASGDSMTMGGSDWTLQAIMNDHSDSAYPGKTYWATEGGYASDVLNWNEWTQSKLTLRMYLEYFRHGIEKTFLYQLYDTSNRCWGLIESDNDPKKSFYSLKDMMSILDGGGTSFTPGSLSFTLSYEDTKFTHYLLLQNDSGIFYLIMWYDGDSWDQNNNVGLNPTDWLTINWQSSISKIDVYRPCKNGTSIVKTFNNPSSTSYTIPDHPVIFKITPN